MPENTLKRIAKNLIAPCGMNCGVCREYLRDEKEKIIVRAVTLTLCFFIVIDAGSVIAPNAGALYAIAPDCPASG